VDSVEKVVALLKELRKSKKEDKISFYPSTRDAISACQLVMAGVSASEAVYMSIIAKAPADEREAIEKVAEIIDSTFAKKEEEKSAGDIFEQLETLRKRNAELEKDSITRVEMYSTLEEKHEKLLGMLKSVGV
jgi:phosphotransferase system HPr-like phosphotransfer protein